MCCETEPYSRSLDLEYCLDLDGNAERKRADTDRRADVPPGVTEDLDDQIRSAVDHFWLFLGVLGRIDETDQLYSTLNPALNSAF